jgi:hypothetical protein
VDGRLYGAAGGCVAPIFERAVWRTLLFSRVLSALLPVPFRYRFSEKSRPWLDKLMTSHVALKAQAKGDIRRRAAVFPLGKVGFKKNFHKELRKILTFVAELRQSLRST